MVYSVCAYVVGSNAFKMVIERGLTLKQARWIIHDFAVHNHGLYAIICQ